MGITVSEASEEDAPLIADLTRKAWAGRGPINSRGHTDTTDQVIYDLPEYAGQNLSQYLIEACINRAQLSDIAELRLFLHPWYEPMTRFYEAYGFAPAPEIEFTLRNPNEPPPFMMRKDLH